MIISSIESAELDEALAVLQLPRRRESAPIPIQANLKSILVARNNETIVGAVFAQKLPGAVGVIRPAISIDGDADIEDALNSAALRHVAGVKIVQAFLSPNDLDRIDSLHRAGFQRITQIWEMRRALSAPPIRASGSALVPFSSVDARSAEQILMRCHENSLDCPEIHGILTEDEVLAGYRDCAPVAENWWLAKSAGDFAGTLILADKTLAFVGVVPEQRGRGIARAMVEAAIQMSPELSLIVDARNKPALQLYASLGFEVVGRCEVLLNFLSKRSPPQTRKSSKVED